MARAKIDFRKQLYPAIKLQGLRAVARTAGIDHANLAHWLKGRRDITASTLLELLHVLGYKLVEDPDAAEEVAARIAQHQRPPGRRKVRRS
jgi:transcriptional regulator with XRE-family HTH domain